MDQGRWDKANFARLQTILDGPPGLAAFDFDNTLIYNDLGEACMYHLARRGLLPVRDPAFQSGLVDSRYHTEAEGARVLELAAGLSGQDAAENDRFAAEALGLYDRIYEQADLLTTYLWSRVFFMGRTPEELSALAREVLGDELKRAVGFEELRGTEPDHVQRLPAGIRIVPEVAALIRVLLERDWRVRIVTASPRLVIAPVAERWGLRPEDVTGMELAVGSDGKLLPEVLDPMPCRAGKVTALRAVADVGDRPLKLAAGDSIGDWELLAEAEHAIFFDRGKPELRARAAERGFLIEKQFPPVDG